MLNEEISIEQALTGCRDFYQKIFQSNGYYPVFKFVYHPESGEYEQFNRKWSGWVSWGISKADGISNIEWLRNIFECQACVFSYGEMVNNRSHDSE